MKVYTFGGLLFLFATLATPWPAYGEIGLSVSDPIWVSSTAPPGVTPAGAWQYTIKLSFYFFPKDETTPGVVPPYTGVAEITRANDVRMSFDKRSIETGTTSSGRRYEHYVWTKKLVLAPYSRAFIVSYIYEDGPWIQPPDTWPPFNAWGPYPLEIFAEGMPGDGDF